METGESGTPAQPQLYVECEPSLIYPGGRREGKKGEGEEAANQSWGYQNT